MKKNHFYLAAILLFIVAAGFIVVKYKKEETAKNGCFLSVERQGSQFGEYRRSKPGEKKV